MMATIEDEIRQFIVNNFLFGDTNATLSNDDSFLEKGIMDSTGVLELVTFLEAQYKIEIKENELVPANLDSLSRLVTFVGRKTEACL